MKFALVGDLHYGPPYSGKKNGIQRKLVQQALPLVQQFVKHINNLPDIDFVVELGDTIEDVNDEAIDIQYYKEIYSVLLELRKPLHVLIGNHDQRTLSHDTLRKILGYDQLYYSFKLDGFKLIALHATMLGDHTKDIADIKAGIDEKQLIWLERELATQQPVIIFSHYSSAEMNLKDNFWFDNDPVNALLANRKELRAIIEKNNNVIAFINGHVHWNNITIHNKIPYITQQSLVENFCNTDTPAATFSIVTVADGVFDITMFGNDRTHVKFGY